MRRFEVEHEGTELLIRIRVDTEAPDQLVPMTPEALDAHGLEYRPILRLAESRALTTVRIGRRRYTKLSWLLELADALPHARAPTDEVGEAARRRGRAKRSTTR